ncbi:MAG: hypothetical protein ABIK42_00530 [candidate division WOR-3 bacterium]
MPGRLDSGFRLRAKVVADVAAERYLRRLVNGECTRRWDEDIKGQVKAYQQMRNYLENLWLEVRRILEQRRVPVYQFLYYRNFAQHIDRLWRHYSGRQLVLQVQLAIEKWQGYGLRREILREIFEKIIGIEIINRLYHRHLFTEQAIVLTCL